MSAVVDMVQSMGGEIVECCFMAELDFLNGREKLPQGKVFSLLNFQLAAAIRAGTHPPTVFCEALPSPFQPLGNVYVLDAAEQAAVTDTVNAYNALIAAEADSLGFAFYDPNPKLLALRASGDIPIFPDLSNPTAAFGQFFSLDGVHPAAAAHVVLANEIIDAINAKYGTSVPHSQ